MSTPNEMSIGAFNKHMGYKGRYAYELHKAGRLVMTGDGKHVLVAESIQRINETKDPSRQGVADRHAQARGYEVGVASVVPPVEGDRPEEGVSSSGNTSAGSYQFYDSKAKKEHYAALREENAYRKEAGDLMDAAEAIGAFADVAAKVANVLDAVPATVGPMLAGLDQTEVMRILAEQMDIARAEMAAAINKMAQDIEERKTKGVQ